MPMKVLIIPDKFKGTLNAEEAAEAIAKGWSKIRPEDTLDILPMSDGGDGFGRVMSRLHKARMEPIQTVNAAGQRCVAQWGWDAQNRLAIIESASTAGLALLPPGKYHPFKLDSFGLGAILEAAWKSGARRCVIGIGGSATNDGGFGVARACGWKFW